MSQYILLSSINEVYYMNLSGSPRIISFSFALFALLLFTIFLVSALYLSISSYKIEENNHNLLSEFFKGIKSQPKFKLSVPIQLIRRALYVALVISLVLISSKVIICILSAIQIIYGIYVIYLRPHTEVKNSLINITNEIYFLVLLGSLGFLNEEGDWTSTKINAYMWVLSSNTMVVFLIVFGDAIRHVFIWIRKRCTRNKNEIINVVRITPKLSKVSKFNQDKKTITDCNKEYSPHPSILGLREESKGDY